MEIQTQMTGYKKKLRIVVMDMITVPLIKQGMRQSSTVVSHVALQVGTGYLYSTGPFTIKLCIYSLLFLFF